MQKRLLRDTTRAVTDSTTRGDVAVAPVIYTDDTRASVLIAVMMEGVRTATNLHTRVDARTGITKLVWNAVTDATDAVTKDATRDAVEAATKEKR